MDSFLRQRVGLGNVREHVVPVHYDDLHGSYELWCYLTPIDEVPALIIVILIYMLASGCIKGQC